jgi:hypothetical protein
VNFAGVESGHPADFDTLVEYGCFIGSAAIVISA